MTGDGAKIPRPSISITPVVGRYFGNRKKPLHAWAVSA